MKITKGIDCGHELTEERKMKHEDGLLSTDHNCPLHISHLLNLVGNNGCGPDNWEQLVTDIQEAHRKANKQRECVVLSYASFYDVIVYPSGVFSLLSNEVIRYKLPVSAKN